MRPKLKEEGSPMESYVGLDVHSKRSVFVIEAEDGRVVARGDIPTTPAGFRQLRQQHELAAETPVALETGTVAFYAARELARVGLRPVVIDAHEVRVKAHRPRQKSDRRDAFELCEGCAAGSTARSCMCRRRGSGRCARRCRGGGTSWRCGARRAMR